MEGSTGATHEIRPMGIGELLDAGFRIWRRHLFTLFLLSLLPNALTYAMQKAVNLVALQGGQLRVEKGLHPGVLTLFVLMIPLFFAILLLHTWLTGAITHAAREGYLGRAVAFAACAKEGARVFFRLLVTSFVVMILTFLGMLFCILPGLYVAFVSILLVPVVCFEGLGGFAAWRRSRELLRETRGRPWWHIDRPLNKAGVVLLVVWMITVTVSSIAGIPTILVMFAWIFFWKGSPQDVPQALLIPAESVQMIVQSLVGPFMSIAIVLLYLDQQHRKEGSDLLSRLEQAPLS